MARKEKTLRCVVYRCGEEPTIEEIPNELHALQELVGGYLERIPLYDNMVILCDDDGKMKRLPLNRTVGRIPIVGTFILVGEKGSEFCSLAEWQTKLFCGR